MTILKLYGWGVLVVYSFIILIVFTRSLARVIKGGARLANHVNFKHDELCDLEESAKKRGC